MRGGENIKSVLIEERRLTTLREREREREGGGGKERGGDLSERDLSEREREIVCAYVSRYV